MKNGWRVMRQKDARFRRGSINNKVDRRMATNKVIVQSFCGSLKMVMYYNKRNNLCLPVAIVRVLRI